MTETAKTINEWANEVFGPITDARYAVARANEEMAELIKEASSRPGFFKQKLSDKSAEEAVDVIICLLRILEESGFEAQASIERKMNINRLRVWKKDGSGFGQHL